MMRKISLMGLPCLLRKSKNGRWTLLCSLKEREIFNRYVYQLFDDDILRFWQAKKSVCAETRFTNINDFHKKLRQPRPIEN